jgi:peptidoglycan hydrolase CwlO-like protein
MQEEKELARLEDIVAKLLTRFNTLQADKKKVDDLLVQREATISTLQDELAGLKDERGAIGSRVSNLLDQIEAWEASAVTDDDTGDTEQSPEGGVQGTLF